MIPIKVLPHVRSSPAIKDHLPNVVSRAVIAENQRSVEEQLASLRLVDL